MKKLVKNLLFGAGIAAVGLAVYSLWKDAEESVVVQDVNVEPPTITPTKEYVERRRQQIRDAAEARRAAQQEAAQEGTAREETAREETAQEGTAQEGTAREETVQEGTAQEGTPDSVPVETDALKQATEQQGEQ